MLTNLIGKLHFLLQVFKKTVTNLKDPDGLFMPLSSASEDLTDHWMSTLAKQLRQRRRVMASKMYETRDRRTELQ